MKKVVLSVFSAVFILLTLTFSAVTVSAYDVGSDYSEGSWVYYRFDFENNTVTVTDYEANSSNKVIIPECVYDYDEYDNYCKFDVTSISGRIDCSYVDYIKIPESVKHIGEYSVGYCEAYDFETDEEFYEKKSDFTIACVKGSYAESYARANGFNVVLLKKTDELTVIFDSSSYIYSGYEIMPEISVYDGARLLTAGTDYSVSYENNINAGTAYALISGMGDYCGTKRVEFTINPVDASQITVSSIEDCMYCGESIEPWFDVYFSGRYLYEGSDYTVSYRNNRYPGTAYIDIIFTGNYSGIKTLSFKIYIDSVSGLTAGASSASDIRLSWDGWYWDDIDCYYVYRYDNSTARYVYIGKTDYSTYYDGNLSQYTTYKYQIVPVVIDDSNTAIKGEPAYIECTTLLKSPSAELTTLKSSIKIKYKSNSKADGYIIYRQRIDNYGDAKIIKTIKGNSADTYYDKSVNENGIYAYYICSYKNVNGNTVYGERGDIYYTDDADAVLRGAELKSHKSFKVYNKQGKSTTSYTYKLSENDIKILKNFAEKHFKKSMTEAEKLSYTLNWLNKNVKYAVGNDWNKISGKSWVEAAFKSKMGQCAQYNGAMAAMMVYLGYDACVIQSYRGSYPDNIWQHFWCEVEIQGRKYLMETGNYGKNGYWSYFLAPYSQTSGYVINRKPAEIAESTPQVASVKLSKTKYTYSGKVRKPKVVAKDTHGNTLEEGKDYTVKYSSGRKKVGKYTVTVKFKGKYSGTKKLTFSIVPKSTSVSKLKAGSKKITVTWKKQTSQTTGYQIEYSTSSKMKKSKKVTVSKNSTTSKTIKSLKKGKKYYVRVRTYKTVKINGNNTKLYSGWSEVKSVRVK